MCSRMRTGSSDQELLPRINRVGTQIIGTPDVLHRRAVALGQHSQVFATPNGVCNTSTGNLQPLATTDPGST